MVSPSSLPFHIDVRATQHEMLIALTGELDMASAQSIRPCIEAAITTSSGDVIVDLAAVTFMDSSGLAALLDARQLALRAGRRLGVQNIGVQPRRVLELSGVDGMFSEADAPS
jgi:anti-sigma B factor antagonist